MRSKAPFLVPVAFVTEGNKEFSCCGELSGVCFLTTITGFAHGDKLLVIIAASSKFLSLVSGSPDTSEPRVRSGCNWG